MAARLALLFITIPIAELALLVWLGSLLGFWPTMALVVVTGVAGAMLARAAGVKVVQQIRAEIAAGRMPVDHMIDGLLVLIGGVLLLTPGILSDLTGIALLIPGTRSLITRFVQGRMQKLVASRRIQMVGFDGRRVDGHPFGGRPPESRPSEGRPFEGRHIDV
ncbi:MAG TPA: FxsA family protein [Longimicrobiales bacterium]|nr:FxsA family protein [Longimicrobiales bacterium]